MRRYWTCSYCGRRVLRTTARCPYNNILGERCAGRRPKPRVPKHARTLRDDSYEVYNQANADIHGVTDESCGVCGKPRGQGRRHDRDHGHLQDSLTFGKPRGLACVGCNRIMVRELTAKRARLIALYLERADAYYEWPA